MIKGYKWDPYFMAVREAVSLFWGLVAKDDSRRVLYILGRGFDPRTTFGVELIPEPLRTRLNCLSIEMLGYGGHEADALKDLSVKNHEVLKSLLAVGSDINEVEIHAWSGETDARSRTGPDQALRLVSAETIDGYTDVVVDVSALPRGIYFPLLSRLAELCVKGASVNLHVFVAEDPSLDNRIQESGLDEDAYFVPPFRAAMELASDTPVVWLPLLGEAQQPQVELVQALVRSKGEEVEVCPVLPLPSRNPRRADRLLRDYSSFLSSGWENDSRNFVYVAEGNPFQAYRRLVQSARQYSNALQSIGGCRVVISAHSSKLLSVGATLAAIELKADGMKVGLANVDATAYHIAPPSDGPFDKTNIVPHLLSLTGESYQGNPNE